MREEIYNKRRCKDRKKYNNCNGCRNKGKREGR
jgi:hypothetical protein